MGCGIQQNRPSLWTRARSTVVHLSVGVHGPWLASVQYGSASLCEEEGSCHSISAVSNLTDLYRYSLLPALSLDGMLYAKIVEGSFTTVKFKGFLEGLLDHMQPFPAPNSVIVMDNARIHKHPDIRAMIEERSVEHLPYQHDFRLITLTRGMRVMYLPPYSPDYNPIELAFSAIKAFVRREGVLRREDLDQEVDDTFVYVHLIHAAYSVTPDDALGFFHHCGYV